MLESKLHTGTSKTKKMQICLDEVTLFWMSQWTACSPAWRILYHVTASCKGPIAISRFEYKILRESPCEDQAGESTVYLANFPDIRHTCVPSLLHQPYATVLLNCLLRWNIHYVLITWYNCNMRRDKMKFQWTIPLTLKKRKMLSKLLLFA